MKTIRIANLSEWRAIARQALVAGTAPEEVRFIEGDGQTLLFEELADEESSTGTPSNREFRVPDRFIKAAIEVGYHREPHRWNLLYRLLWRLTHGQPQLLEIETDDDVWRLNRMLKEVRRDAHKMKAFVRFRKVVRGSQEYFIAWHRPDHRIVRKVAPFFSRRFKAMNWTILTPDESVVWDQQTLTYGRGVPRSQAPDSDELETLWQTYYANIFNPARVKIKMMKSEMPVRHWATLPEAELIADLIRDAPIRVEQMIAKHEGYQRTASDQWLESELEIKSIDDLKRVAEQCTACELHREATQTVFGSGPGSAELVVVGEQPGDHEDHSGIPFTGPAGQMLDEAFEAAGLQRETIYVTNIVKHFKHRKIQTARGKKRLHQRPDAREIRCCRPWFDAEWSLLTQARVLVCLGATAATTILGPNFRISRCRGQWEPSDYCEKTMATWHPSAILRTRHEDLRREKMKHLIGDLIAARKLIEQTLS